MNPEQVAELHASVIKDINAGLIVEHGDVVDIEFSADGSKCLCLDCQSVAQSSPYLEA